MRPSTSVKIRLLGSADADLLGHVAPDVFDGPVLPRWTAEFLSDDRHHLVVALDDGLVVGMASAMHYVHPDKPPELWINEVGVAPTHRNRGIGTLLLDALFEHARTLGCTKAWLLTEEENTAARRLYARARGTEEERPVYVTFDLAASDA